MRFLYSANLVVVVACLHVYGWDIGQEVSTTSGSIKGHASSWQPEVSEYLGIPFAQPPVGPLRFAAPQKYRGYEGIIADHYVSTYKHQHKA